MTTLFQTARPLSKQKRAGDVAQRTARLRRRVTAALMPKSRSSRRGPSFPTSSARRSSDGPGHEMPRNADQYERRCRDQRPLTSRRYRRSRRKRARLRPRLIQVLRQQDVFIQVLSLWVTAAQTSLMANHHQVPDRAESAAKRDRRIGSSSLHAISVRSRAVLLATGAARRQRRTSGPCPRSVRCHQRFCPRVGLLSAWPSICSMRRGWRSARGCPS